MNFDPSILAVGKHWFEDCLGVSREDFNSYVYISASHKEREKEVLYYLSKELNIPISQFHSVLFLKNRPKKKYANHNEYYGVLSLRIKKGTDMKYRIQGLIDACKQG